MNTGKTYERANKCGTVTRTNPRTDPPSEITVADICSRA